MKRRQKDDDVTMGEVFDAMAEERKKRHAEWMGENTAVLVASGLPFKATNYGQTLMFREPGKPVVDFYPSTGRWHLPKARKTMSGGATAFLHWYSKQC